MNYLSMKNFSSHIFADVVGLIDGILMPVLTSEEDGSKYMSHKGFFCMNMCVLCDAVGLILYKLDSTPGIMFGNGDSTQGHCLGDSECANARGIMTPFRPFSVGDD